MDKTNKSDHSKKSARTSAPGFGERLTSYLNTHQHIARSVVIAACLLLFLEIMPPFIRNALLRGLHYYRNLTAMLIFLSLLSLSLLWSTGQRIDAWIFLYFNFRGKRPLWLDRIMEAFTQLGNGLVGMVVALILFFIDLHRLAYELLLGTLTLWLLVELVKAIIHRSRPFTKLTQARIVGPRPRGRSFPSGHTSQAFFIGSLLIRHFHVSYWAAVILYALAALVAIARMYVGAHYPRDVLAGAILGSIWGFLGVIVDAHFLVGG